MLNYLLRGRRLALTIAVLVVAGILCSLGFWQLRRLNERITLINHVTSRMAGAPVSLIGAPVDPAELDYRRVQVRGTFDPSAEILRRNRSYDGATGYHIVTPLRISGSDQTVLVDRGWIPYDRATPEQRRAFAPPSGEVVIEGVALRSQDATAPPIDPPLQPGQQRLDAWFRINIARIQEQVDAPLLPVFIEQQPDGSQQQVLPIKGETAPPDQGNHLSYAIQWFSFAVILLGGYVAVMYQQRQRAHGVLRPAQTAR